MIIIFVIFIIFIFFLYGKKHDDSTVKFTNIKHIDKPVKSKKNVSFSDNVSERIINKKGMYNDKYITINDKSTREVT